jgi:hypothetical protein
MLFQPPELPPPVTRRGAILLVVISMLVLFAAVALSFVYLASSEATASRVVSESQSSSTSRPDVDSGVAMSYYLSALLWGSADDSTGVYNALRGQELSRMVYGWDDSLSITCTTPFNGDGRPHSDGTNYALIFNKDGYYLPNYTYYSADGFLRDPEHKGQRANVAAARGPFVGGWNVPYTYPDLNNLFIAAVNANGEVLVQSFYRPWAGGTAVADQIGSLDPSNPNWAADPNVLVNKPWLKYATVRPLPAYHTTTVNGVTKSFPAPTDGGGDVKNLDGWPGVPVPGQPGVYYNCDSIWVDAGFPVLTAADGTKYKPLFAALIMDLDGKINLNAHGNIRGQDTTQTPPVPIQVSNQGWGAWEVAISRAMLAKNSQWTNLFLGNGSIQGGNTTVWGRYGRDGKPGIAGTQAGSGEPPRFYGQVDYDATTFPNYTIPLMALWPGDKNNTTYPPYSPFLFFPPTTYTNGDPYERTDHPLNFNVFNPPGPGPVLFADDRVFLAQEMEPLLRYGSFGTPGLSSDLFKLCPQDFTLDPLSPRIRRLVTTHSLDLSRPGSLAWLATTDPNYGLDTTKVPAIPTGPTLPYAVPTFPTVPVGSSEFQTELRALTAQLGRANLNQPLPPYPTPDDPNDPKAVTPGRINPANYAAFTAAQQARQSMAQDLFTRLTWVTTGQMLPSVTDPTYKTALSNLRTNNRNQYNALRYLAQLAVNIVDYRDIDNYSTPFNWDPNTYLDPTDPQANIGTWVFGVEPSRAMLNEIYAEVVNDPTDPLPGNMATKPYRVNFWAEVHNPYRPDQIAKDVYAKDILTGLFNVARLEVPAVTGGPGRYAAYQVVIAASPNPELTQPVNTLGAILDPKSTIVKATVNDFDPQGNNNAAQVLIQAAGNWYAGTNGSNEGFYVLGPAIAGTAVPFPSKGKAPNLPQATQSVNGMSFSEDQTKVDPTKLQYSVLLQRLTCPDMPPNDPSLPGFDPTLPLNPYVTVDYVTGLVPNNGVIALPTGANPNWKDVPNRASVGRRQPFDAATALTVQTPDSDSDPTNGITPWADRPQQTLFRHNAVEEFDPNNPHQPISGPAQNTYGANSQPQTLTVPFDWLTHVDRQIVNPMELLHVSACPPPLVTQLFQFPAPFSHLAPWLNQNTRLYRFLEYVKTNSRAVGMDFSEATGGRLPGKVNINMIFDPEILDALTDPQSANYFPASVTTADLFRKLIKSRSPDLIDPKTGNVAGGRLLVTGSNDRPFLPLSAGVVPTTNPPGLDPQWQSVNGGINDTILRVDPEDANKLLFGVKTPNPQLPNQPPYLKTELLQKIFNNTTTRSNVFAVWVTVGFFEVTDDTVQPVKLGPEIGVANGSNIRHRMFAIIDRSNLAVPALTTLAQPVTAGKGQTVSVGAVSGTATAPPPVGTSMPFNIQPGMQLVVEQETITVTAVTPAPTPTITADFAQNHPLNAPVSLPGAPGPLPGTTLGNPGPQLGYDPRNNGAVVLYYNIIQ